MTDTRNHEKPLFISTAEAKLYKVPIPENKWKFCLNGDWSISFLVPTAPNAFNRVMQKLLLGIYWEKL